MKAGVNVHSCQYQPDWNMKEPYLFCLRHGWYCGAGRLVDGENGNEPADLNTV